jgi:hypothetical protein
MERGSRRNPIAEDRRRTHARISPHAVASRAYTALDDRSHRDVIGYRANSPLGIRVVQSGLVKSWP